MTRILKLSLCLGLIASAFVSCKRQYIYDPKLLMAKIPITIDWSASLVDEEDINNVSVYFYPVNGGEPTVVYPSDTRFALVSVSKGVYNILIHNEISGNILGVDCDSDKSFYDYTMNTQHDDVANYDMFYEQAPEEQLIKESEAIASWSYEGFEVTNDIIEYTRTRSFEDILTNMRSRTATGATPSFEYPTEHDTHTKAVTESLENLVDVPMAPLSSTYRVTVEINNMNNMQHIEGIISGFVDSATVHSRDKTSATPLNYTYFTPTDHKFDEGSTTNGSMSYMFSNLGHRSDETERYYITFSIILHNGERVDKVIDITDQLTNYPEGEVIEINIGDSFDNDTETIVLPANDGAGFGVGDWGDAENVVLG